MREDATLHLRRYLAPRHWPMWTGLGLLWLGSRLPYGVQMALGRRLGDLSRLLLPARRRVVETNLRLAFPELGPAGRRRLLAEHFRAAGMALFEGALAWWAPQARLQGLLKEVEGEEHLEAAMAAGRGVLLLGGHYTTLEIAGPLVLTLCPVVPTYKPARNPLFEAVMRRARERRFPALLPSRDMRAIIRTLRAGGVVWYAPDQDFGRRNAVFAPFMGVPAATLTLTARLARTSGATVIKLWHERLPEGGYRLRFSPPWEGYPSGDEEADATRYNRAVEEQVHRTPEQYLWLHRRYKTRPAGEPNPYRSGSSSR